MMKNTIECYAEYLYCLSNYEKGKFVTSSHFSILKRYRLKKSIRMMSLMVCVLEGNDCSVNEINAFILQNRGKIFQIDCDFCESGNNSFTNIENLIVINLMKMILNEINFVLDKPILSKQKKLKMNYLLRAFHNLPRAFFNSNSKFFLERDIAVQYANDWLRRVKNEDI